MTPHDPSLSGGHDYSKAIPIPERIQTINKLFDEGNKIVYWTSRGEKGDKIAYKFTFDQLTSWGCKFTKLKLGKHKWDLLIDNHCSESNEFFADPHGELEKDHDAIK